ncbi:MAG: hypothetical protein ACPIOQ_82230, partial [Promethearchaeia archaeon]
MLRGTSSLMDKYSNPTSHTSLCRIPRLESDVYEAVLTVLRQMHDCPGGTLTPRSLVLDVNKVI